MTALADVLAWQPQQVGAAATSLSEAADAMTTRLRDLDTAADRLGSGWNGVAADAALSRLARERSTGGRLVSALDAAAEALSRGAAELEAARSGLTATCSDATARGYTVGADGSVVGPPVPAVMTSPDDLSRATDERDARVRAVAAEAQRIAEDVARGVDDAAAADRTLGSALDGVEVPRSLAGTVEEIRRRHEAGEGTDDILGSLGFLGGAVITARALMTSWKAVSKARALGQFLASSGRAALEAGPALRWLVSGTGDAAAWARAVQAMERAEGALGAFRLGTTPAWMARLPAWVTGAKSLAGRAFLPLTVATGLVDAWTGGGYDGGRGNATRVAGVAGAAGAGVLLASSAGLIALGPVGLGIAGAAVVGYAAWTAGNFVYDHWDDITGAVGTAASWVGDRAGDVADAAGAAADWAGDRLSDAGDAVGDVVGGVAGGLKALGGGLSIF